MGFVGQRYQQRFPVYRLEVRDTALLAQAQIVKVDAGDLIAMQLINHMTGDTHFAFAHANADKVAYIDNSGANIWGWEDLQGGGDRYFNDLVVQLDFTSASGHGWLV